MSSNNNEDSIEALVARDIRYGQYDEHVRAYVVNHVRTGWKAVCDSWSDRARRLERLTVPDGTYLYGVPFE